MKKLAFMFTIMSLFALASCGGDKKGGGSSHNGVSYDQLNPSTVEGYFIIPSGHVEIAGVRYAPGPQSNQQALSPQVLNPLLIQFQQYALNENGVQKFRARITGYIQDMCSQYNNSVNQAYYQQCVANQASQGQYFNITAIQPY